MVARLHLTLRQTPAKAIECWHDPGKNRPPVAATRQIPARVLFPAPSFEEALARLHSLQAIRVEMLKEVLPSRPAVAARNGVAVIRALVDAPVVDTVEADSSGRESRPHCVDVPLTVVHEHDPVIGQPEALE